MLEEINKMINEDNEVLNVLPQNNNANRKKYHDQLLKTKEKYDTKQKEVLNYIKSKNSLLKNKYNVVIEGNLSKRIEDLESDIKYFNPYQDAFEILGLDKLFYNLHKYYDNELYAYNDNISKILDIFSEVGITLTKEDFYYSESSKRYMEVFISERQKGNFNSDLVKETFESLFWKNHNMMRYILLNFYHLYYANEKKFEMYLQEVRNNILALYNGSFDNLLHEYQDLIVRNNEYYLTNAGVFYEKFMSKELNTSDYEKEKIDKLINDYLPTNNEDANGLFMKLYASLREEKFIYKYKFVLDEIDKLFKEKDSFKDLVSTTRKEIDEIDKKIYKNYTKINGKGFFIFKKPNTEALYNEINELLLELDKKYDELDENRYKERIGNMVNPKIKDYYLLGSSYLFLNKILKDQEELDIEVVMKELTRNIYSPYNGLIENINNDNISTLNFIIYDKYRLLGLNLVTDDFNEENIDGLSKVVSNIIIYYALQKLSIDIKEINFILESNDIIK